MTRTPHDIEALLAHAGWVRALARSLATDAHAAEDLAQDTLVAAMGKGPPDDRPLQHWLGGIVRNLWRQARRSSARRAARERRVAREPTDGSAPLLEQLELHRMVVDAVARLDEPYRSSVLLRYFEERTPAAIAAATGVPLRTVHTRLHRGLAKLREDLDRRHGGERRGWLAPLASLAWGANGIVALTGVGMMKTKVAAACAVVALLGIGTTWWIASSDPAPAAAAVERPGAATVPLAAGPQTRVDDAAVGSRTAVPLPEPVPKTVAGTAPAARLHGRVFDATGAAVSLAIRYRSDAGAVTEAHSDGNGRFELDWQGHGQLDVASPGWACILRPELPAQAPTQEIALVAGRSVTFAGLVVDPRGVPVADARMGVVMPFDFRARFATVLDACVTVERRTRSGADGTFTLADVPVVPGASLVTECSPYRDDQRVPPGHDDRAMLIVLRDVSGGSEVVVGRVVDEAGAGVADAWVGLGAATVRSGSDGVFALELEAEQAGSARTLRAVKAGFLPAEASSVDGVKWPDPLVLRLGGASLTIGGRVVGPDGREVKGARVWTGDETHFGYIEIEGGEMRARAGATVEGILRGDPWSRGVRSDRDGRFELRGLAARDYRLHAMDERRLLVATATITAGSREVELRLEDAPRHERIAGQVVDRSDAPIEGMSLVLERARDGIQGPGPEPLWGRAVQTDREGRFAFTDVSCAITRVVVRGDDRPGVASVPIGPGVDVGNLRIVVPSRVSVQVDAGASPDFDRVAMLDAEGNRMELIVNHGTSSYGSREVHLHGGRSETFAASDLAVTLLLLRGEAEVRRVPVQLVPGSLNTIRP